ncbi:MAG TPA: DnaA regulatory inactivator Hda [Gammaproteobacteria bacterium]|nr:DnaA regulatory inactivator Hda [Gammaproteobacteria bacterium]
MIQLPLSVALRDDANFENFYVNSNALLVEKILQSTQHNAVDGAIFFWGEIASGKTHLLQAVCDKVAKRNLTAAYIPLTLWQELDVKMLHGMESFAAICVDDIDSIAGQIKWEKALFELYNRATENNTQMYFSATRSVKEIPFKLADLSSRLSWGFVFHLRALTDEEKPKALQAHAKGRGFEMPDNVARYLLNHYPRDMNGLSQLLERLDKASLAAQRKLTLPFVKQWLSHSL